MIEQLRKRIKKEQFDPGWLALFVNPFYFARKGLYKNIAPLAASIAGRTLDVGCGTKPYAALCQSSEYIGLELDTPDNRRTKKADVFYNGRRLPFPDASFDSVMVNQVFEHVFEPYQFLTEINRVLRKEGMLLMTVPFLWDEHEQPRDFGRYTSFGIASLLERHGFEIVRHTKSVNDFGAIVQLLNEYLYKKFAGSNPAVNVLLTMIFIAPLNILGAFGSLIFPKNDDMYLDNVLLAKKIHNADVLHTI